MELFESTRKLKIAMELSWKATDVGRACLQFLHAEYDQPEARMRLNTEIAILCAQIAIFAKEFGVIDSLMQHLESHDEDA